MSDVLDRARLRTVHLVPLTATDAAGRIDFEIQREHLRRMYAAGVRVFMPAAGTGEFHNLAVSEVIDLVRTCREATGPDARIFAPVGLQVDHAIAIGVRSRDAGADGVMFMPFTHPYLCNAGVRDYYDAVLDQVRLPALIYKKSPVPADSLLLELAKNPLVVGVKYAENNLADFRKTVLADGGRIEWLCGSAERFAPYYMLAGATGYTTGAGNVAPHVTLAMHAAFTAGEWDEGMRLQALLLPLEDYRAREGDSFNISMLKHAAGRTGLAFGQPRPPQRRLTKAEEAEVERLVEPLLAADRELERECHTAGLVSR